MPVSDLPAIVADAYTDANARRPETDAGTGTIIPITIATALDVSLARRIIVGIPDDHAAAPAGLIAASIVVTDQADLLHEIRIRVLAAGIDVGSLCAADKQRPGTRQQRDCDFPHGSSSFV